jgi:Tfp pilus assembly protein PilW
MFSRKKRTLQQGLSVVELMVGIAIGLFIVGGAMKLFVENLNSNRNLLLQTRVNQDLRGAADVIVRDVRRANYWENATTGLFGLDSTSTVPNPHTGASAPLVVNNANNIITYSYARNNDDQVNTNEYSGFKLEAVNGIGVLKVQTSENVWSELTDKTSLDVTHFTVTQASPAITNNLSKYCPCLKTLTCSFNVSTNTWTNPSTWTTPPTLTIPRVTIIITGRAIADSSVERTLRQTVRVRNAQLSGNCPT